MRRRPKAECPSICDDDRHTDVRWGPHSSQGLLVGTLIATVIFCRGGGHECHRDRGPVLPDTCELPRQGYQPVQKSMESGRSSVILCVEDDPSNRHLIETIISSRTDWEFVSAATGEEALDKAMQQKPRLILMDIGLPGIDGIEVTRRLRDNPDLVMGDFNEPPDGPVDKLLARGEYVDAAVHTGQTSRPTNLSGKRGDRIFVHARILHRLKAYGTLSAEDLALDSGGKTSLSDHLPLWIHLEE